MEEGHQRLKRRLSAVEFADQTGVAELAAASRTGLGDVREAVQVVLDEYQDTSSAQAELLQELFSSCGQRRGAQAPSRRWAIRARAIYGWRGAAAANIITFADHLRRRLTHDRVRPRWTAGRVSASGRANALSGPLRADEELQWDGIATDLVAPPGTPPEAASPSRRSTPGPTR